MQAVPAVPQVQHTLGELTAALGPMVTTRKTAEQRLANNMVMSRTMRFSLIARSQSGYSQTILRNCKVIA